MTNEEKLIEKIAKLEYEHSSDYEFEWAYTKKNQPGLAQRYYDIANQIHKLYKEMGYLKWKEKSSKNSFPEEWKRWWKIFSVCTLTGVLLIGIAVVLFYLLGS